MIQILYYGKFLSNIIQRDVTLGFISRCTWNASAMKQLLIDTDYPDMVCIQEARLKAFHSNTRGRPLQSEYTATAVKEVVETIFVDYQPVWSLADSRYAGTLTFLHKRLGFPIQTQTAFTVGGAIDLLLKKFHLTREQVGLPVEPQLNAASSQKAPKQASIKAFFSPKKASDTISVNRAVEHHHSEGRLQFFCFCDMDVMQCYVPNNGTNEKSFERRREWDDMMIQFLKDRRKVLDHCSQGKRPLLWCGDFNVARCHLDGTHWEQRTDGTIYEFWTDPKKCSVGKQSSISSSDPAHVGIPSFTPAERRRFSTILKEGILLDVWRELHPSGVSNLEMKPWDRPEYTWRGHLAQGSTYTAKFQGKGQRLDYFLLTPPESLQLVNSCEILGYGEKREGHFCGSDHCATFISLERH